MDIAERRDNRVVPALLAQLEQLHKDLEGQVARNPYEELTRRTRALIHALAEETRALLADTPATTSSIVDLVATETSPDGEPIVCNDAVPLVGQLLALVNDDENRRRMERNARAMSSNARLLANRRI